MALPGDSRHSVSSSENIYDGNFCKECFCKVFFICLFRWDNSWWMITSSSCRGIRWAQQEYKLHNLKIISESFGRIQIRPFRFYFLCHTVTCKYDFWVIIYNNMWIKFSYLLGTRRYWRKVNLYRIDENKLSENLHGLCLLWPLARAVDLHSFFADPYPVFLNADPDPAVYLMRIRIQLKKTF